MSWYRHPYSAIIMIFWYHHDISKYQTSPHLVTPRPTLHVMISILIFCYYHDILILSWYIKVSNLSTHSHSKANTLSHVTVPKFAISQSEAKFNVLISYNIKSLTWYPAISWSLSSKVMLPYDKLQRGFANKQTTLNLRFSWCFAVQRRRKNLSRQN